MFILDSRLQKDTIFLGDFPLSQVRLMNDTRFPWVILIPRINEIDEIFQLSHHDQKQLIDESSFIAEKLKSCMNADKMNIAALGNIVSQLHIHHVARFVNDEYWPVPIWGVGERIPYPKEECVQLSERLKTEFSQLLL